MSQIGNDTECVYSRLGGDPDLGDLVVLFANELPERIRALLDYTDRGDWESLQRAAHQVKGAAGSYGFDAISPAAGKVEYAVRNGESEEQIRAAVAELSDLCGRVRCGNPPSEG
jgi:HPt (histidine-containing phosphotransfer) domain-containing protein